MLFYSGFVLSTAYIKMCFGQKEHYCKYSDCKGKQVSKRSLLLFKCLILLFDPGRNIQSDNNYFKFSKLETVTNSNPLFLNAGMTSLITSAVLGAYLPPER